MARSPCFLILKFLVFINNFIYWLLGLGAIAVSLFLLFDEQLYTQTLESQREDYFTGTYFLLCIGAVITLIGFLGCCGAWRESAWMLGTFFAFLCILLVAEVCLYVFLFFREETMDSIIGKSVEETVMKKYEFNISAASVHTFDKIQEELECCGVEGPQDWSKSIFNQAKEIGFMKNVYKIPRSCCRIPESKACLEATELQINDTPDQHILFTQGCATKMTDFIQDNYSPLLGIGIGIVLLEIHGMILSMLLCCAVRRIDSFKA